MLYLVVARRSENGRIGDADDGALYRSLGRRGVESWQHPDFPDGVNGPTSLPVDTKDPHRLCLSAWGRVKDPSGDEGGRGIYLSTDAGRTWRQVLEKDIVTPIMGYAR